MLIPSEETEKFIEEMIVAMQNNIALLAPYVRRESRADQLGGNNAVVMMNPMLDLWGDHMQDDDVDWPLVGALVYIAWLREREKKSV